MNTVIHFVSNAVKACWVTIKERRVVLDSRLCKSMTDQSFKK